MYRYAHMFTCIHVHGYKYIYTYIYICMYIYIFTQIDTGLASLQLTWDPIPNHSKMVAVFNALLLGFHTKLKKYGPIIWALRPFQGDSRDPSGAHTKLHAWLGGAPGWDVELCVAGQVHFDDWTVFPTVKQRFRRCFKYHSM